MQSAVNARELRGGLSKSTQQTKQERKTDVCMRVGASELRWETNVGRMKEIYDEPGDRLCLEFRFGEDAGERRTRKRV